MALITKPEVISRAFDRQVETNKIVDDLIEAIQVKYIMPLLGEDFYDALIASPTSYTDLLEYIKPVLAYFVKLHVLPTLWMEVGSVGIAHIQGRNREQVNDYEAVKQATIDTAKMYALRLAKYLDDNSDSYPLYYQGSSPEEMIIEAGGILFRKRKLWEDDPFYKDDDDYTMYLKGY